MSDDSGWVRDKLFQHAADLGAQRARQDATDQNVARIADAVEHLAQDTKSMISDGMRTIADNFSRETSHVRGEIARIDALYREQRAQDEADRVKREAEEKKRTTEVIESLRETAERSEAAADRVKQVNRNIIFVVVLAATAMTALMENAAPLMRFLIGLLDGVG